MAASMEISNSVEEKNLKIVCGTKVLGGRGTIVDGTFQNKIQVAVKRVLLHDVGDLEEIKALENLHHSNVVKLFHYEDDCNFRYYALELCAASLDKLFLKEGDANKYCGPVLPAEDMIIQLAQGLEYIHENKLVHRDIRPENALIWVKSGHPGQTEMKWADFGLSKRMEEKESHRNWLAPEQLKMPNNTNGNNCVIEDDAKKSDVFSAGLTFAYILLKGKHPNGTKNADEAVNFINNTDFQSQITATGYWRLLDVIQERMLERNPKTRSTAKDIICLFQHIKKWWNLEIQCDDQKILGSGASAFVFMGTFGVNRVPVAVKRIQLLRVDEYTSKREEDALLSLNHPNVVKLFHVEKDKNFRYYALELCATSIDELFQKDEDVINKYSRPDIILQLAKGLDYIHDQNLVHRDLKPHNALIWEGPAQSLDEHAQIVAKWADFGLSKPTNERGTFTMSGVKGTHSWLAPEILKLLTDCYEAPSLSLLRSRGTTKSDVFAEGLTFAYILLGGEHPYGNYFEVVSNLSKNNAVNLPKISNLHEGLLFNLIQEMLETTPIYRPTAKDVLKELHQLLKIKVTVNQLVDRDQSHQSRQPKIPCQLPNNIRFLSTSEQLLEELRNGDDDGSFVVVLHLPAVDWHTPSEDDSIDKISNQFADLLEPSSSAANWQSERRRQRFLSASLAEFSNWVTYHNQETTTNIHYVVFYDRQISEPAIRLYESGSGNLISMNHNIPKAPGKVAIKKNCPGIFTLSWAVEKEDNITSYLLQYQLGGCGESWNSIQHPTNTIVLDKIQPNEIYFFRVAAVTRIGRSPFSLVNVIKTGPISQPGNNLQCTSVTDTTITMDWTYLAFRSLAGGNDETMKITSYSIECWKDGLRESTFIQRLTTDKTFTLEPLNHDTDYCIQVKAVCKDVAGTDFYSQACPISKIRTRVNYGRSQLKRQEYSQKQRITEKFEEHQSSQIIGENQLTIQQLNKATANLAEPRPAHADIRVADTCIGRSECGDVDNESTPDTENSQFGGSNTMSEPTNSQQTMATGEGFKLEECIQMAALGRCFQIGNLYDYRNDRTIENRFCKEPPTQIEEHFKMKITSCNEEWGYAVNKWELMGLDDHLKATAMAGLIDKYNGASNYLNDRANPTQASRVLVLRVESKKECLNLQKLPSQEVSSFPETTEATHIVVGITYGAEAYCVLTYDLDKKLDEEEAREVANEALADLATKIENALTDSQDLASFQGLLNRDERQRLARMKCRLYADFQTQAVRECNVFDAYKHCLKLIEQVIGWKTGGEKGKAVPLTIKLCPLKNIIIDPAKNVGEMLEYRDVDADLISRCCVIWGELERISGKAEAVHETIHKSSRPSVRQFSGTILKKFRDLLKKNLKNAVIKARDGKDGEDGEEDVERLVDIAERHPLFKPSRLEEWLSYKKAESKMIEKMDKVEGVGVTLFSSKAHMEDEISDSGFKHTLVLSVSALDQWTRNILVRMKECIKSNSKLDNEDSDGETTEEGDALARMPWHMVQCKRKQVLDKMRELADHAEKNKHLENQVHFFALIDESQIKGLFHYSVYELDSILRKNLRRLPAAPTGLRIQLVPVTGNKMAKNFPLVCLVEWDYEYVGYPYCHFLVEHRPVGGSENWIQEKTTKPGEKEKYVKIQHGSPTEIRVAADTCIGRSEYSETVIVNESTPDDADNQFEGSDCMSELSDNKPVIVPLRPQPTTKSRGIELEEYIKMAALGRRFQLGNLYDYRNDRTIDNTRLWDPDDVARSAVTHKKVKEPKVRVHQMNIEQQCDDDGDEDGDQRPWMSDLGIDDHSAMSLTAGLLLPSIEGAWKYAKDRLDGKIGPFASGSEVAVYCRRSSKKVSVDPTSLEVICRAERLAINKATHVVVAITYGHEAFCIFSHQDLQNKMAANKELVEKIVENAHFFASGLLEEKSRLQADLDEEGDEEDGGHRFVQLDLQCLLYSDLANTKSDQSWTSNSMVKQFEICRKLLGQHKSSVLPLKVWLYPIGKLIPNKGNISKSLINHTDVSRNLMILCQSMLERLRRVRRETDLVIGELKKLVDWLPQTILESIKYFDELMTEFTLALFKYLSEWTTSIRKGQKEEKMADMLKTIEKKSPFFQKELRHWLKQHKKQIETLQILIKVPGVQFESKLEHFEKAIKNGSHQSFAVVLHLPNLCEQSDGLLQEMSSFIGTFTSDSSNWERKQDKRTVMDPLVTRWFFTLSKEFSSWIADHNSENTNVRYIVFYDERPSGQILPILRLYDGSSGEPLSMNFTIPKAPGPVTIEKNHRGVITLHWAAEERTDFSSYLIQYRTTDNPEEIWNPIQHLSNTITIEHLHSEKSYIFRVAIVTQGGRSPFGPVSEYVKIDPICPPPSGLECQYTTDTSIAISWKHQMTEDDDYGNTTEETIQISSYSIECWSNESSFIQRSSTEKTITLEPLVPGTEYCVQVSAVCRDVKGSTFYSSPCPILKIRTLHEPERAALIAQRVSQKCFASNLGIDVYNLPLKKYRGIPTPGVCHYAFGERSNSYSALIGRRRRRTILVLGATGSGKTTLINAMVNYMLGVQWKDDFRFKLIDEPDSTSQAYSQTKMNARHSGPKRSGPNIFPVFEMITAYDLYEMKGSRLDYSLTVVDTPGFGDTKGLERDKKIMDQLQSYFKSHHGIQQLEAVCFVVQSALARLTPTQQYIFERILSIFGQDIKDNIRIMVTFADNHVPPVLAAVKEAGIPSPINPATGLPLHHKFNNSIFFTTNKNSEMNEIQETYFNIAIEGFDQFFNDLSRMEATSLTLTREVLEERKRLEALVEGLQMRTEIKLTRVDELEQIKKILTENKEQMEANKDFEFEVELLIPKAINISGTGQFTTNCQKCQMTCHFPCRQASDENKNKCSVMDSNGRCRVCSCPWNGHYNQKYRYEMVKEKVKRSSDAIRKEYQGAVNEALTNQQLLESVEKKMEENEQQLFELMQATYPHVKRLDEIALRPNPTSELAYIDLMIETEKNGNRQGYQQRIATLQKLRKMAELKSEVLSGEVAAASAYTKIDSERRIPNDAGSICQLS